MAPLCASSTAVSNPPPQTTIRHMKEKYLAPEVEYLRLAHNLSLFASLSAEGSLGEFEEADDL